MNSTKKINVLISGASIAGLTTAYWLIKYGFDVTVVERASGIRAGGQALDVRGPALEVAEKMGILNALKTNSTKLTGMSMVDAVTDEEIYRNTEQTLTGGRLDSNDVEILRDDLCQILLDIVGSNARFLFNNSIASIEQDGLGAHVIFTNAPPQHFDLVIGADGLRSNVRKLVFGNDEGFVRYLGHYVAIFTMPNFLELDRWEVFYQHEGIPVAACIGKEKESNIRAYLGFANPEPINYDYRSITAQKDLVAERTPQVGNVLPQIVRYMYEADNFYFDSVNQVMMDSWSKGLVTLVGDAGYSVSVSLGQGTTVAMVGGYVLASELAAHMGNISKALESYEELLRDYVINNQALAYDSRTEPAAEDHDPTNVRDLGQSVVPFTFKNYTDIL
jgi:2-polyprenyl-6-methoxyphenol hydroxylase-like FAD-dependent oxidoreductase